MFFYIDIIDDAITNLAISNDAAITITANAAPANNLLKPLTE